MTYSLNRTSQLSVNEYEGNNGGGGRKDGKQTIRSLHHKHLL